MRYQLPVGQHTCYQIGHCSAMRRHLVADGSGAAGWHEIWWRTDQGQRGGTTFSRFSALIGKQRNEILLVENQSYNLIIGRF